MENDEMDKEIRELIKALPRCIHDSRKGLRFRCPKLALYVMEEPNGERNYGEGLCDKHSKSLERATDLTRRLLRYSKSLIKISKLMSLKLETDDIESSGIDD